MNDGNNEGNGPSEAELEAALGQKGAGRELRIGIFVLLGLVSFITVLFLLTDPATLRGRYMVVTELADAGGIRRGDPVQMRGVNIGRVHAFEMTEDGRVAVTLEIEGEWRIPRRSEALLTASGVFGGRTMSIVPSETKLTTRTGRCWPMRVLIPTCSRWQTCASTVRGRIPPGR